MVTVVARRKLCACCRVHRSLSSFHRNSRAKDGLATYCKVCTKTKAYTDPARTTRVHAVARGERRNGLPQRCSDCGQVKPFEAFRMRRPGVAASHCRDCWNDWRRDNRIANPDRERADNARNNIRRHRGMTEELFDRMFIEQRGRCAICGQPMEVTSRRRRSAHIDHNHETGKVRALLCAGCNTGIGSLGEDVDVLFAAISYLIEHGPDCLVKEIDDQFGLASQTKESG